MNSLIFKYIYLFLFLVFGNQVFASFRAVPLTKWDNGICTTTMRLVTTGDAGPFQADIYQGQTLIHSEANLDSNVKNVSLNESGQFRIVFTDALGCVNEIEVEAICDCDDLEYVITAPSCHLDNGVLEFIPPIGSIVQTVWVSWPANSTKPSNNLLIINNLVIGEYTALFSVRYSDPSSGDFITCDFEKTFDLSDCNCELEIENQYIEVKNSISCSNPNGSIVPGFFGFYPLVKNNVGDLSDLVFKWSNSDGVILQEGSVFDLNNLDIGDYTLEVIDAAGCKALSTFTIDFGLEYEYDFFRVKLPCDGEINGSIEATATFLLNDEWADQDWQYQWSTGFIGHTLENVDAGIYTVTMTDLVSGCHFVEDFFLELGDYEVLEDVDLFLNQPDCLGRDTHGSLSIKGGTKPYNIEWSDAIPGLGRKFIEDGSYTVTVTDFCNDQISKTFDVDVVVPDYREMANLEIDLSTDCHSNGSTVLRFEGGVPPFTVFKKVNNLLRPQIAHSYEREITVPYDGADDTYWVHDHCGEAITKYVAWEKCTLFIEFENIKGSHPNYNNGAVRVSYNHDRLTCEMSNFCRQLTCPSCLEAGSGYYWHFEDRLFGVHISNEFTDYGCLPPGTYDFILTSDNGCSRTRTLVIEEDDTRPETECIQEEIKLLRRLNSCDINVPSDGDNSSCNVGILLANSSGNGKVAGWLTGEELLVESYTVNIVGITGVVKNQIVKKNAGQVNSPFDLDFSTFSNGAYTIEFIAPGNIKCATKQYLKLAPPSNCNWQWCHLKLEPTPRPGITNPGCVTRFRYCIEGDRCMKIESTTIIPGLTVPPCPDLCKADGFHDPNDDCNVFSLSKDPGQVYYSNHNLLQGSNANNPIVIFSPLNNYIGSLSTVTLLGSNENSFLATTAQYAINLNTQLANIDVPFQSFKKGVSTISGLMVQADNSIASSIETFVPFFTNFESTPVVIPTLLGESIGNQAIINIRNVSSEGFYVTLKHASENLLLSSFSYVAIEQGIADENGRKIIVKNIESQIDHTSTSISFDDLLNTNYQFNAPPNLFAYSQNSSSLNPSLVAYQNLNNSGFDLSMIPQQNDILTDQSLQEVGVVIIEYNHDCNCVAPLEDIVFSQSNPTCGLSDGSISILAKGGVSPYTYTINNGGVNTGFDNELQIPFLNEGEYVVVVTDSRGCKFEKIINLIAEELSLENFIVENVNCSGSSYTVELNILGGSPPFSYIWSNNTTSNIIEDVTQGTYSVTVIDSENCIGYKTFKLQKPYLYLLAEDATCEQNNGGLGAHIVGVEPFTYSWSNGQSTQEIVNLEPSTYTLTVTDGAGCTIVKSQSVSSNGQISVIKVDPFCGANNGSIVLDVNGVEPIDYQWSTGDDSSGIKDLGAGTYSVTVTDAIGCVGEKIITLTDLNSIYINGSGGNEGLSDGRYISGGVEIDWAFNPFTVTDQLIITSDIDGVIINTGGVTKSSSSCCFNSNNCCSDFFLGDHSGATLNLLSGLGYVNSGYTGPNGCVYSHNLSGTFTTQSSGNLSIEVIGANCGGGTAWSLSLSCNGSSNRIVSEMSMKIVDDILMNESVSIEDEFESSKKGIRIFPNPANSLLFVELNNGEFGGDFFMIDIHGKRVVDETKVLQKNTIDIGHLNSGIYFLVFESDIARFTKKVSIIN